MIKYFKVAYKFFIAGLMSQLEYRFERLCWIFTTFLWMALTFVSIELVFGQTTAVAGWTKTQVMLVAATEVIFTGILYSQILPSIIDFTKLVERGNLDFYLTKPLSTRFLVSTHQSNLDNFPKIALAIFLVVKFLQDLNVPVSFLSFAGYFGLISLGLLIFYNVFFMLVTTAIWFTSIFNILDLMDNILDTGRFPVYIFEGILRSLFIFIIPIIFIATFPVQFLLGRSDISILVLALFLALLTSILSQKFWIYSLKHYSSASS